MNDGTLELVEGSGNVFRDFGDPEADLRQARAILATRIIAVLDEHGIDVQRAARMTGFKAAEFSCVRDADLGRFTLDQLMRMIASLDDRARVTVHVVTRCSVPAPAEANPAQCFPIPGSGSSGSPLKRA